MGYAHMLAFDSVVGANPSRPGGGGTAPSPTGTRSTSHSSSSPSASGPRGTSSSSRGSSSCRSARRRSSPSRRWRWILSGGRLRLGVGVGWNTVEFEALGETLENRGKRTEEQPEVLRLYWSRELVTFEGQWHRVPDAGINPLPCSGRFPSGWEATAKW